MSSNPLIFTPVLAKDEKIQSTSLLTGWLYFATDTGKMYLDTDEERISVGGAGAALYYGKTKAVQNEVTLYYHLAIDGLENDKDHPKIGDIILNNDGAFYRILEIDSIDFICSRLAVSGTGEGSSGPSSSTIRPEITVTNKLGTNTLINGQDFSVYVKVDSYLTAAGAPYDELFTVYWELTDTTTGSMYKRSTFDAYHGVEVELPLGEFLRNSTTTKITIWAEGGSHDEISRKIGPTVSTSELRLALPSTFSSLKVYSELNNINFTCNAYGDMSRVLIFYFGDSATLKEIGRFNLTASSSIEQTCKLPVDLATHGSHKVRIELWQQYNNGSLGLPAEPIEFEIAITDGVSELPIIWLGNYSEKYYSYDSIIIPYAVYNPTSNTSTIVLKKDNILVSTLTNIKNTTDEFEVWEIADATVDLMNYYQIGCGEDGTATYVQREINFKVEVDPTRKVEPIAGYNLYFNPKGRSNNESPVERASWSLKISSGSTTTTVNAKFENFNWSNNGWIMDDNKNTVLRVSNGAKFSLPLGEMIFAGGDQSEQSHTIEMQLKIYNNQLYSNLISNVTRYKVPIYDEITGKIEYNEKDEIKYNDNDNAEYAKFLKAVEEKKYDNYDKFLLDYFSLVIKNPAIYDALLFNKVLKDIDISKAVCQYQSDEAGLIGLAIGTLDAFFTNGSETVSVSFVENDIINLTFIYNDALKLLEIFINGVISGVIESTRKNFTINSDLIFDSSLCDIDIYSIRTYNKELNINNIVHNYAVDRKDIETFDHVNKYKMAFENELLLEYLISYKSIQDYNAQNPNNPTIPYIIFDSTDYPDNKLPWTKKIPRNIRVEFVNAPLESAYENGELEELARKDGLIAENETNAEKIQEGVKTYYKHHCPSWTSTLTESDINEISVQGTSSEFYPRRNFKIKTKIKDVKIWDEEEKNEDGTTGAYVEDDVLNIYMNRGPFASVYAADKEAVAADDKVYGHEESRLNDGWYMNNYTNGTDRWTMKVDYMESSGSYNAGFASMVSTAYSKHPLHDYLDVMDNVSKLGPVASIKNSLMDTNKIKWDDYRTSLLGFPVMAFQKRINSSTKEIEYLFIGYYRMLLDKGSDEVLGFKPDKKVTHKLLPAKYNDDGTVKEYKRMRDVAECWEFSTNNRGYCSYRDPYNRVKLSFKAPIEENIDGFVDKTWAPVVTNDFEYRYHAEEDGLDALLNYKNLTANEITNLNKTYGTSIPVAAENDLSGPLAALDLYVDVFSKNWEELCQWVYSTNLDDVIAQYDYQEANVGEALYQANTYYIYNGIDETTGKGIYELSLNEFNSEIQYFIVDATADDGYRSINLVNDSNYVYTPGKFYQKTYGVHSLVTDAKFNPDIVYYENTEVANYQDNSDLLVAKATEYDSTVQYYTYNDLALVNRNGGKTGAVQEVTITEEEFNNGIYYIASPVKFPDSNKIYTHDTKEYRAAKFKNELTDHFDPEYLATYFVMTEVFECYDSRGKNCMMATWGPQVEGGNYIWYPIFYDIDTQLGINNTGIPSFEYNVDATDEGNYSTNDSILWNNFYSFFKNSYMLDKYILLRNSDTINRTNVKWYDISNPPLVSVDNIEKWYLFDSETHNNIACRGVKPLIATNLDEYFKYITITNSKAIDQGVAYIEGNSGDFVLDTGTFFYALQGDRSQSRRQFLTNRLEYIDSWLNQMNYARNGANRIRGRISANNTSSTDITSDKWVEPDHGSYWTGEEFASSKTHEFDAEYWLTLTPTRSAYVTAGDDSENYASEKYDGITPVRFVLTALENGIRKSNNYNELLLYIYGLNQMKDVGDMSKLYWTEFNIEGNADKLTRLLLGYDGLDNNGKLWYNKKLNAINLKASLQLLKEANFSGITITSANRTLDLKGSPKLENFRAVRSNIEVVHFAGGVALNTLYLPDSIKELSLDTANMLNKLIVANSLPIPINSNGILVAEPGLYIDGLFDGTSDLQGLELRGGSLGYLSYTLMEQLYKNKTSLRLTLTDVDWCPYTKLVKGDVYDEKAKYYIDNGHYGFEKYTHLSLSEFNLLILNGEIYRDDNKINMVDIKDDCLTMLENFIDTNNANNYKDFSSKSHPEITGIIYIENTEDIDESYVSNTLLKKFPGLQFFFKNVHKAYSAKFVLYDEDTKTYSYVPLSDGSTSIPSILKITQEDFKDLASPRFNSPFELYKPKKDHYDFKGWSTSYTGGNIITTTADWNASSDTLLVEGTFDYIYYARFDKHKYEIRFYNNNDSSYGEYTDENGRKYMLNTVTYGEPLTANVLMPQATDITQLEERNAFRGWTLNEESGRVYNSAESISNVVIDVTKYPAIKDYKLYAVFLSESVYATNTSNDYFTYTYNKGYPVINLNPTVGNNLSGKITLPAKDPNGAMIQGVGLMTAYYAANESSGVPSGGCTGANITHIFFEKGSEYKYVEDCAFINPKYSAEHPYVLEVVYLPDTIVSIGAYAFAYLKILTTVPLNDNITTIGREAFNCGFGEGNGKVVINALPKNLTSIGATAFRSCGGLNITSIPDGVEVIPSECMASCPYVRIDTFGGGNSKLTTIETAAFRDAGKKRTAITDIYLHEGVKNLGYEAFARYGSNSGPTTLNTANSENEVDWSIVNICGSSSTATINYLVSM